MNMNCSQKEVTSHTNSYPKRVSSGRGFFEDQVMKGEPNIAAKANIYLDILNNEILED